MLWMEIYTFRIVLFSYLSFCGRRSRWPYGTDSILNPGTKSTEFIYSIIRHMWWTPSGCNIRNEWYYWFTNRLSVSYVCQTSTTRYQDNIEDVSRAKLRAMTGRWRPSNVHVFRTHNQRQCYIVQSCWSECNCRKILSNIAISQMLTPCSMTVMAIAPAIPNR